VCTDFELFTIESEKLSITVSSVFKPTCPGDADGAVVLTSESTGVLYAQVGGNFDALGVFDDLSAGTYHFTAQKSNDATCQSNVVDVIIDDPEDCGHGPLVLSILATAPSTCNASSDGRAQVRAEGGVPPYEFYWDQTAIEGIDEHSNLAIGQHTIYVMDGINTIKSVTIEIVSLAPLSVESFTTLASCATTCDGKIQVLATGGSGTYSIDWNGTHSDDFELDHLCAGSYQFTVTDNQNNLCAISSGLSLDHYPSLQISEVESDAPTCPGGTDGFVTISVEGGSGDYEYLWNNGVISRKVEGHVPGSYLLTVTDALLGCTLQSTHEVPDAVRISVVQTIVSAPLCHGNLNGKAELVLNNANSPLVKWQNGQLGVRSTGLATGSHAYTITSSEGCQITGSAEVPDRLPLITAVHKTPVTCFGICDGQIQLIPEGGTSPYFVKWAHGPNLTSLKNLCAGVYQYAISDNNNCKISGPAEVLTPAKISVATQTKNPTCFGNADGEASVVVNGGITPYTYAWSTGAGASRITELKDGEYTITVKDANLCVASVPISLTEPDALLVHNIISIDPSCPASTDGRIAFTTFGGTAPYTFSWENGSTVQDHADLRAGDYTVVVSDAQGCTYSRDFTLTDPAGLEIVNVVRTDPHCFGDANGSIALEVIGGAPPLSFKWTDGTSTIGIDKQKAGVHSLTVKDSKDCSLVKAFTLQDPLKPVITGLPAMITICTGGVAAAEPSEDWSTYDWKGPEQFKSSEKRLQTSLPGKYFLVANDFRNCPAEASLEVEVSPNALVVDFLRISEAVAFEPIVFVDISQPIPSFVEWLVPDSPDITISNQSTATLELIFTNPGTYEIGMHAALDNCISELYKVIEVREPDPDQGSTGGRQNTSADDELEITLYPNPASQELQIRIHASQRDAIDLRLLTSLDNREITSDLVEGHLDYLIQWDIRQAKAGVYYLIYEQKGKIRSKRIVVIK
jgi:hypothetical protein